MDEHKLHDEEFVTLKELETDLQRQIRETNEQLELNKASRAITKETNKKALLHVEGISNRLIERGTGITSINDIVVGAADDSGTLEQLLEDADKETLNDVLAIIANKINQIQESK